MRNNSVFALGAQVVEKSTGGIFLLTGVWLGGDNDTYKMCVILFDIYSLLTHMNIFGSSNSFVFLYSSTTTHQRPDPPQP